MAALQSGLPKIHRRPEVSLLLLFSVCCASVLSAKESPSSVLRVFENLTDSIDAEKDIWRHLVRRDAGNNQTIGAVTPVTQCPISCQGIKQRPVCASDGVTYSSKCELRRLRDCDKKDLRVISKGRCPGETKCQEERRVARFELWQRPGQDIYIPECKDDGSFMKTQCHEGTGYCWCVRSDGKPIPGSSVEGHNTDCLKFGKKSPGFLGARPKHRRGVGIGGCSPIGRSIFNRNLIKRFNEEFGRAPRLVQQTTDASFKPTVGTTSTQCQGEADVCAHRRVVEWKFSELDLDKDVELDRKELKTLRYLVNKIVEPHACALSFLDYCDWDNNKKITLNEWSKCLRVIPTSSGNASSNAQQTANPRGKEESTTKKQAGGDRRPPRIKPGPRKTQPTNNNRPSVVITQKRGQGRIPLKPLKATFYDLKSRNQNTLTPSSSRSRPQESEQKDNAPGQGSSEASRLRPCDEERQKAKDMDRADPDGHIFIPECETTGLFKKAQCHNSTGYCWCVDDKTGIPIPGISTHNVTPDCSDVRTNRLKGCPFATKKRFLTELLDQITQEMVERANNGTSTSQLDEPDPEQSIEERAVRWKLTTMDTNHNGLLEKGEVKDFREEIKQPKGDEKYMRKCRRNFLQYCDEDNDSKITTDEWITCMGLNEQPKNLPENPKRIGKNPFSTVLKS